jgi:hypothetical protein
MNEKEKKAALQKVPTRQLVASVKKDLRKALRASGWAHKLPKK